jgi:hypothetical protein
MSSDFAAFDSLRAFYAYADAHAHEFQHLPSLGTVVQQTRDRLSSAGEDDDAGFAQVEVDVLSFDLRDGDIALFAGHDGNGELVEYPDYKTFIDDRRSYVRRRLHGSDNPTLLARYAHILWKSGDRKIEHAHRAIDSYLDSIDLYVHEDRCRPDQQFGLTVTQAMMSACRIAFSINDEERIDRCKRRVVDLVTDFNTASTSRHILVFDLIGFALQNKRRMSSTIETLAKTLNKEFELNYSKSDYHGAINLAELIQKLPNVKQDRDRYWHRRIADCYEQLAKRATDPRNPISSHFYAESIRHFRLGGASKETLRRLTHQYEQAARQVRYGQISVEVDLSIYVENCKAQAALVVQEGEDAVIQYLMTARFLIPPRQEIERNITAGDERNALLAMIPVTVKDHLGRQAQHFSEAGERSYASLMRYYPWWLSTRTLMMLMPLLYETVKGGTLHRETVLSLFRSQSWISTGISRVNGPNCDSSPGTWLDQVVPGIEHYFDQVHRTVRNPQFQPTFELTVDSLVPKVEGMMRDLCRLCGGVTVNMTTDHRGRTVEREKDLHSLLYEDAIVELLDEDDLLYFRFLLVEQGGYNLRNLVAHGLTTQEHYTLKYALLTLLAVFRIARYEVRTDPEGGSHDEAR